MPAISTGARVQQATQGARFFTFVTRQPANRAYLLASAILFPALWLLFKYFYPHPNIIFDSYYYMLETVTNARVGPWPIGYPQFIRLIGAISHHINLLLTLQYLLLNLSLLLLFFTVRYFFHLSKYTSLAFFVFIVANPVFLYISNIILSDALFTTLSLLWLTQLLWLLFRPKPYMVFTQAFLLLLTFTVRYNALYYPILSTLVFLLSRQKRIYILSGIALQIGLLWGFISYTTYATAADYKVKQFSPFGAWKLANNALYVYENVYRQDMAPVPEQFQVLDTRVRNYFSQPHYKVDVLTNDATWGSFYMWLHPSPLIQHMFSIYGPDNSNLNFVKFAPMGPFYQEYGAYIIKKHPLAFARYFVAPNILRYFNPPQEVLIDHVNPFALRRDRLGMPTVKWFGLTTLTIKASRINFRSGIFLIYPAFCTLLHYLFVLSGLAFLLLKGYRHMQRPYAFGVLTVLALWLVDFGFNITAAAVVLRYQLFIMTVEFAFTLVIMEFLYRHEKRQHPLSVL